MKNFFLFLLCGYLMLVTFMYIFQRQMLYSPAPQPQHSDDKVLTVDAGDLKIKVVVHDAQFPQAVIYFGGNGEDAYESAKGMQAAFRGKAAYYVNYPGYGGSTGTPTQTSISQSARDLYTFISARHSSVALVGRSLGTGVVVMLASEYAVSRLVLISPYDSIADVAYSHYPFFPAGWLLKDKFASLHRGARISGHVLVILAAKDTIIPVKHSLRLIDALKKRPYSNKLDERLTTKIYTHADHNNLHLQAGFMALIEDFLRI
ncbi:MAG: fermentation-respiration switch protein FrsA (DUF1100 family) [Paraglaciecola sp.]|jgi:fermentation-respiration switch protein FrsA (DUF1100 family)